MFIQEGDRRIEQRILAPDLGELRLVGDRNSNIGSDTFGFEVWRAGASEESSALSELK
ncbi:MAG: hypothetical protein P1U90_00575 [Akkermansiaceae bacterium]|nr:hypothetical protein [Akkermansiaceae bacterium]